VRIKGGIYGGEKLYDRMIKSCVWFIGQSMFKGLPYKLSKINEHVINPATRLEETHNAVIDLGMSDETLSMPKAMVKFEEQQEEFTNSEKSQLGTSDEALSVPIGLISNTELSGILASKPSGNAELDEILAAELKIDTELDERLAEPERNMDTSDVTFSVPEDPNFNTELDERPADNT
jgi:hypothetical protein